MGQSGSSGARLEERYFLQKVQLGQGSFGTVWRAIDRETDTLVAIKMIDKAKMPRCGINRGDIAREASIMKACRHDSITKLYNTYEDARCIYLALEYCDGGDFGDKLLERASTLQDDEAADWMSQIISAIAALHARGVCHRDIKPDNFMVCQRRLKLSDFGLALHLPSGKLLSEKCGTLAFMAPEQHRLPNSRGYGHAVDVWAAGVVMFMVICDGRHPFVAGDKIDLERLNRGDMSFAENKGFFSLSFISGKDEQRFPEEARKLCRALVKPQVTSRLSAAAALEHPWLAARVAQTVPCSGGAAHAADAGTQANHFAAAPSDAVTATNNAGGTQPSRDTMRAASARREAPGAELGAEASTVVSAQRGRFKGLGRRAQSTPDMRVAASTAGSRSSSKQSSGLAESWAAVGKAARAAAAEAMVAAPRAISKTLEEVKDAMQTPNPLMRTSSSPSCKKVGDNEERTRLELELDQMGATPEDLTEVRELLDMGADIHDVRHAMRKRIAAVSREKGAPSTPPERSPEEQEALESELLHMGFDRDLAAEAANSCSSADAAVDWVLGRE